MPRPLVALVTARGFADMAEQTATFCLIWTLLKLTDSPQIFVSGFAPLPFITLLSGVIRQGARRESVPSNGARSRAPLGLRMAFAATIGRLGIVTLIALDCVQMLASFCFSIRSFAIAPEIAHGAEVPLLRANTWTAGLKRTAEMSAPVLGTLVLDHAGLVPALSVVAALYTVAMLVSVGIGAPTSARATVESAENEAPGPGGPPRFRDGIEALLQNPTLRGTVLASATVTMGFLGFNLVLVPLIVKSLDAGPSLLGAARVTGSVAGGLGILVAAGLARTRPTFRARLFPVIPVVIGGAALTFAVLPHSPAVLLAVVAVIDLGSAVFGVLTMTRMQTTAPPPVRRAALSSAMMAMTMVNAITMVVIGSLVGLASLRVGAALAGAISLLGAAIALSARLHRDDQSTLASASAPAS